MAGIETFRKILKVREQEKMQANQAYKNSIERFEKAASELYRLLKEREEVENSYQNFIAGTATVTFLQTHHSYVEKLTKQIINLQNAVNKARNEMESRQGFLTEAHVEVKKFEKLIENKVNQQTEWLKAEESKWIDEISTAQFANHRNG